PTSRVANGPPRLSGASVTKRSGDVEAGRECRGYGSSEQRRRHRGEEAPSGRRPREGWRDGGGLRGDQRGSPRLHADDGDRDCEFGGDGADRGGREEQLQHDLGAGGAHGAPDDQLAGPFGDTGEANVEDAECGDGECDDCDDKEPGLLGAQLIAVVVDLVERPGNGDALLLTARQVPRPGSFPTLATARARGVRVGVRAARRQLRESNGARRLVDHVAAYPRDVERYA